jgi:uncharacterized protein YndB with AHSA1/START domain
MINTSSAHAVGRTVRVARVIPAPPEMLFALWTDPAAVKQWWGKTEPATLMTCEVEIQPGGALIYAAKRAGQEGHEVATGTFLEVAPPHRLVMSWSCEERNVKDSVVTVEFVNLCDGSSRVSVVHERLPSPAEAAIHQAGWSDALQDLATWVSAPAEA